MEKKTFGLFFLLLIYIFITWVGYLFMLKISDILKPKLLSFISKSKENQNYFELLVIFISNVFSTVVIWLIGLFCGTASVYDPYWSVQTPVIYIYLLMKSNVYTIGNVIFLILILFWAIRLTLNFCYEFSDLSYIDWRYRLIKKNTGILYPLVDLVGICLVPTIIVYAASIPAFLYVQEKIEFNERSILGYVLMFIAVLIEKRADEEMRTFRETRKNKDEVINIGLWKKSRHPNYFGEICFWYGVSVVYVIVDFNHNYKTTLGAFLVNLLFLFISIPLAENNLSQHKKGFELYKKNTSMLIPCF